VISTLFGSEDRSRSAARQADLLAGPWWRLHCRPGAPPTPPAASTVR